MKTKTMCLLAACLALGAQAQAAPVAYAESVSGDISDAPNEPTFGLDAGANTVSGTQSIAITAAGALSADRDPFFFTVPVGMRLTGLSLSWSNWQPSGGVVVSGDNGLVQCELRDDLNALLASTGPGTAECASFAVAAVGAVDLFPGLFPLEAGTYRWANTRYMYYFLGQESAWSLDYTVTLNVQAVPLPGTLALAGLGLAALGLSRRRRG